MTKHTKCKWEVEVDYYGHYILSDPKDVHRFPDMEPDSNEAQANARLIAAAPDMLEALETLQGDINTALLYMRINKKTAEYMTKTINQAITKATS